MAVVMISIRIGELVVVAVKPHPVDGSVLTAQGAAGGEEALQPWRHTERAMGKQAVTQYRTSRAVAPCQLQCIGNRATTERAWIAIMKPIVPHRNV